MLLLLEQPLVYGLLEQGLRGLWRRATLRWLRALGGLLRTSHPSSSTRSRVATGQAGHRVLLLHLEVVLVLEPLLEDSRGLLLS